MKLVDYPSPPALGALDCLVKIGAVGICGSDVHFWEHGRIGDYVVTKPMVIGHESVGTGQGLSI
jgi:threonine dehydrogenase-like Zn-dependent dehydrogenase